MKNIFGTFVAACSILAASNAIADSEKKSSGRDGVQCIDGGESACGIAWEGKGLFNISARARFAFRPIWEEDLDLQQAYLCCTVDKTRTDICHQTHTWVTWDHCNDYVLKFFDPNNEAMVNFSGSIGDTITGGGPEFIDPRAYPTWTASIRKLTEDIYKSNPDSASASKMYSCMEEASSFKATELHFLAEQFYEVFDVITIVDLPFSFGSLFVERGIAKGLGALADVQKEFILKGVANFSEDDIRTEIMLKYMDVVVPSRMIT